MKLTLQGGMVYQNGHFEKRDVTVSVEGDTRLFPTLDGSNLYIFPGFADVHVHLREPGFSYKETVKSGTMAGARGGYTALCSMPNLKPTPDSLPHLKEQLDIIARDGAVAVSPLPSSVVGSSSSAADSAFRRCSAVTSVS